MNKKYLLYFKKINMSPENLNFLIKKFKVIEIESTSKVKKLKKKIKDKISVIYCDPSDYYSKNFFKWF